MDLNGIFKEVSEQMVVDINTARKAIEHRGIKGEIFEDTFKSFLRKYLPGSLDISTGQIVDTNGKSSKQLDVIISDNAKTPIFYRHNEGGKEIRVMPVEGVYAVIEVKARLDKSEIDNIFENMISVKNLEKKAFVRNIMRVNHYGKMWDIWPIHYYVFAYDSTDLEELTSYIHNKNVEKNLPINQRIDTICILKKALITNKCTNGKFDALPQEGSILSIIHTEESLLAFYTLTSSYFFDTGLPKIIPGLYGPITRYTTATLTNPKN